ncbi:AMP-binding protein [Phenylobacterium sp.]|uniref:AMP-binding protein n=1 Tax=Phenylobacterium sp. TaxID=1871053 RepID=UPI0027368D06|nr:AMP-binding protein [Phenylobacterium sp.]MDP3853661.1 AMP-binding protein [Phenylobacterium sp.]
MLYPSGHKDTFARDHLPPEDSWPVIDLGLADLDYPRVLNCAAVLIDAALDEGFGDKPAILQGESVLTYSELAARTNRIARVLTEDLGVVPGGRVLLRGENSPVMFACWLAVIKAGAIAVTTMPMLRAAELKTIIHKAQASLALCGQDLCDEVFAAREPGGALTRVVSFGPGSELDTLAAEKPATFEPVPTSQDDVCLIAFTSGTTGEPKAAMHFHRDVLAMCDTFCRHILRPGSDAIFTGTPPIAFTFGLGALLVFPLRFRATAALPHQSNPDALWQAIARHRATHVFTSPTGYRAMLARAPDEALASVEACVSAGEHLPKSVSDAWFERTGVRLIDGIGATEMIHIFISATPETTRPGAVGKAVPGFQACLLDDQDLPVEGVGVGRLGVRGPTGCRYLSDARQAKYVVAGWNVTGDIFRRDEDGYYWYVARADDMIVSSGYNIAGPEIEAALMTHPSVNECAVVGWPDRERGQIVKAVIVVKPDIAADPALAKALQDHVKATLAPYKYPRLIEFRTALPKTTTGKIQRSALRAEAH